MSFYLVVGMHRSGTSCLAGSLERCGIYLGDVSRKGKHNKKGYFENKEVFKIHDQILNLNKRSWHQPPKYEINVHQHHYKQLETIVKNLIAQRPCGLKDPRVLLLLNDWKKLTGYNYQLIGTFRHPIAVAQSLYQRNQLPLEQGVQLWIDYNKILVEEHQKNPFPIIHFKLVDIQKYRKNIIRLAKEMGLKPNYWKLFFFIKSKLEHNQYDDIEIPSNCIDLYQYLLEHKYK